MFTLQSLSLAHGHIHLEIPHRRSLHLAWQKVGGRSIESAHGRRVAELEWTHLDLLFLMQLHLNFELLGVEHGLALGHFLGLPLVTLLDVVYFII